MYLYKNFALLNLANGKDKIPKITSKWELSNNVFRFSFSIKYKPIKQPIRSMKAPKLVNNVAADFSPASSIIKFEYTKKMSIPYFFIILYRKY